MRGINILILKPFNRLAIIATTQYPQKHAGNPAVSPLMVTSNSTFFRWGVVVAP